MKPSRLILAALPVGGLLLPILALAAGTASNPLGPRFSVAAAFALGATVSLLGLALLARTRAPRAGAVFAGHAAMWPPVVFLGALRALGQPVVPLGFRCTGDMAALMVFGPFGGAVLFGVGMAWAVAATGRRMDAAASHLAYAAVGFCALATAMGALRSARPDPDTYLASLVARGVLREGQPVDALGRSLAYARSPAEDGSAQETAPTCRIDGLKVPLSVPADEQRIAGKVAFADCPELRVSVDPEGDVAVIEGRYRTVRYGEVNASFVAAFRPSSGALVEVGPREVGERQAPPIGWRIGAALSTLAGALLLAGAWRARRRARRTEGTEAHHRGGGWVGLEDGRSVHVEVAAMLPAGPVVLGGGMERTAGYREPCGPSFTRARSGTIAEARQKLLDFATSLEAIALASALLGAAPLLACRIYGLL